MNVLVLLRAVRDPASFAVNSRARRFEIRREAFICNPADRNALEAGLRLAEAGGRVTAMAQGGAAADEVLQLARALGAARGLRLDAPDEARPEAGALTEAVRLGLAAAGPIELVLLGDAVLDADLAQVGPRLAQALGWPFIESAWQVTAGEDGGMQAVVGEGHGYRAVGVDGPAVVSMRRDCNRPRYAPAGEVVKYFQAAGAVEVLPGGPLAPAPSNFTEVLFPAERRLGVVLDGARPDTLQTLAAALGLAA